jgi:hypothetical protein
VDFIDIFMNPLVIKPDGYTAGFLADNVYRVGRLPELHVALEPLTAARRAAILDPQ